MTVTFVNKDWSTSIIERLQRTVSYSVNTKTIHPISGEETLTAGTASSLSMVFYKTDQKWFFDKEGMVEGGDAFGVTNSTADLTRDDKVIVDSETFRVHDKIAYYSDNNQAVKLFTYYNLFKVE